MSTPRELWKQWEGRVVDGKLPLRQWLGGSDHSAVFLTERSGGESQKAAIKLIPAETGTQEKPDGDVPLSRWASAAKLSHPHLLRIFEYGQIDDVRLFYVVMECAEENLAEVLPLRALSADEVSEMLRPAAEALAYLHQAGFVHGRIKPSNIMAVNDQLKISADGLCRTGERDDAGARSAYDAPEVTSTGLSTAADIWSLGATLVAVLTQKEPKLNDGPREAVVVPETIPQPLREIVRQCLLVDPQQRCRAEDILGQLQPRAAQREVLQPEARPNQARQTPARESTTATRGKMVEPPAAQAHPKRWIATPVVFVPIIAAVLLLVAWVGSKLIGNRPPVPVAGTQTASPRPADVPAAQSPAPFSQTEQPAQKRSGGAQGSVLQQVLPNVSRSAQNTIEGRVKVSVQVSVDASGNVSQARLVSAGPSAYFANRALAAARGWKFNPPQVGGRTTASEWTLRFQFGRTSIKVFPTETHH